MKYKDVFKAPKPMKITGRTSTVTNSFVTSIVPSIEPTEQEIEQCLKILELDPNNLRCAYCGDKATEWDHLRPLVKDKKPTGYIAEIRNLVPACGKCNQSKGNKYWKDWIEGNAKLSPKTRQVKGLDKKIEGLRRYERWGSVLLLNFEEIVGVELWNQHWHNCEKLHKEMRNCQTLADRIKALMEKNLET